MQFGKEKIQELLIIIYLFSPIVGKKKQEKMFDDEWEILHLKATATIQYWADVNIFHKISKEVNVNSLYRKIKTMYKKNTFGNEATTITDPFG